jgi:hypothetical protein
MPLSSSVDRGSDTFDVSRRAVRDRHTVRGLTMQREHEGGSSILHYTDLFCPLSDNRWRKSVERSCYFDSFCYDTALS